MGFMEIMRKIVNICVVLTLFFCKGYAVFEENPPYLKYVDQIIKEFVHEMERDYGLICDGSGGSMPKNVQTIDVSFNVYHKGTIEEARVLMVKAKTKLVEKVNTHEKIRPYLKHYPFRLEDAEISLAFLKQNGAYYLDDSVAFVCTGKDDNIAYKKVELQMRESGGLVDLVDGNHKPREWKEQEVFVCILREPFTETMRIVQESSKSDKKKTK